ncbi:winged helix-turn-helix transcriptional regulator [candidate division WOR-3 bacterium]|nr:winged helix-turn-helix transcriptional regulator [candidate division WOR-3 bacterium]
MLRRKMPETDYRASRFCRVLGNPTAYQILKLLVKSRMTPTELSKKIGLSLKTISDTLRNLRQINLVRYETRDKNKIYFLKDKSLIQILTNIGEYVEKMRVKKW